MENILNRSHGVTEIPTMTNHRDYHLQQEFDALSLRRDHPNVHLASKKPVVHVGPHTEERLTTIMKDCVEEMRRCWGELLLKEALRKKEEDINIENNAADRKMINSEPDSEEAVRVERVPECLIIRFMCPCGEENEILFSGSTCYYKL